MRKLSRGLLAVGIAAALAFGGVEALTSSGATVQDCPDPCFGDGQCVECCGTAGSICQAPGVPLQVSASRAAGAHRSGGPVAVQCTAVMLLLTTACGDDPKLLTQPPDSADGGGGGTIERAELRITVATRQEDVQATALLGWPSGSRTSWSLSVGGVWER